MQDCKDGSRLQFIKFDFVTGSQENKIAIRVERILSQPGFFFVTLVNNSLLSSLVAIFSSFFKTIKQA